MRQRNGDRALVAHVSGEDRFDHFAIVPTPAGRLRPEDFERVRADAARKRKVLYEGPESHAGKRY